MRPMSLRSRRRFSAGKSRGLNCQCTWNGCRAGRRRTGRRKRKRSGCTSQCRGRGHKSRNWCCRWRMEYSDWWSAEWRFRTLLPIWPNRRKWFSLPVVLPDWLPLWRHHRQPPTRRATTTSTTETKCVHLTNRFNSYLKYVIYLTHVFFSFIYFRSSQIRQSTLIKELATNDTCISFANLSYLYTL
jgi:hypothetical protein